MYTFTVFSRYGILRCAYRYSAPCADQQKIVLILPTTMHAHETSARFSVLVNFTVSKIIKWKYQLILCNYHTNNIERSDLINK